MLKRNTGTCVSVLVVLSLYHLGPSVPSSTCWASLPVLYLDDELHRLAAVLAAYLLI